MSGPGFTDVRMRGFQQRAEVEAVLAILESRVVPLPGEDVPLLEAAGRVLAEPLISAVNVPNFARSAMDGFAVCAADTSCATATAPVTLAVAGESLPAKPFQGEVKSGQAVRIMTGAPVPAGADAVLMAEFAQLEGSRVLVRTSVTPGKHVVRVGEDVAKGSAVLPAGRRLRPQDVGLLASIGAARVRAIRRPRVAILVTGNELLPPGTPPEGFKIVDSNSPMLAALAVRDGAEVVPVRLVPDDYTAVREAIRTAAADADVILMSGGTSVGTEDHAPRAATELGELAVHGVALRPAGPLGVAFLARPNPPTPFPGKEGGENLPASPSPSPRGGGGGEGLLSEPTPPNPPSLLGRGNPGGKGGERELSLPCSPLPLGEGLGVGSSLPLFLIPGNPVACLCAYDLFAGRVVRRLGGRVWESPYRRATLPLAGPIASVAGRVDYVRVKVNGGAVHPLASGGASNLSTTVAADGFVLVPRDAAALAPGERVDVWLYDG